MSQTSPHIPPYRSAGVDLIMQIVLRHLDTEEIVLPVSSVLYSGASAYGSSMGTKSGSRNAASVHAFMPGVVSNVCW